MQLNPAAFEEILPKIERNKLLKIIQGNAERFGINSAQIATLLEE